ncbi:8587_t:CDS:2 [Diversispora eburnea]|uniref:8587_t:CDS:1 n=1 Tax=Diversispora eburnea TaxID=1213867 RepID=A0A9N8UVB1_9GLOM|nr:8587_t:CDS:2 [Diversispora eburnea]
MPKKSRSYQLKKKHESSSKFLKYCPLKPGKDKYNWVTDESYMDEEGKTAKWDECGQMKLSAWKFKINDLTRKANIYPNSVRIKTAISTLPEWMQIRLNEVEFNNMSPMWRKAEEIYKNKEIENHSDLTFNETLSPEDFESLCKVSLKLVNGTLIFGSDDYDHRILKFHLHECQVPIPLLKEQDWLQQLVILSKVHGIPFGAHMDFPQEHSGEGFWTIRGINRLSETACLHNGFTSSSSY